MMAVREKIAFRLDLRVDIIVHRDLARTAATKS